MKAIETQYKGYRFRSRREARWAVFFDALGISWDYEPEGFELGDGSRYLPDFYLREWDHWLEVKPDFPTEAEIMKCRKLATALSKGCEYSKTVSILCGSPGELVLDTDIKGKWIIKSGAVVVDVPPDSYSDIPLKMKTFSEAADGDVCIWSLYLVEAFPGTEWQIALYEKLQENPKFKGWYVTPTFPEGFMPSSYIGDGQNRFAKKITDAYAAARSARFEFGETGNKCRISQRSSERRRQFLDNSLVS